MISLKILPGLLAGETSRATVVLNSGTLSVTAFPKAGAKKFSGATWYLYKMGKDNKPESSYHAYSYSNPGGFTLTAGPYWVTVKKNEKKWAGKIRITAGKETRKEVVLR